MSQGEAAELELFLEPGAGDASAEGRQVSATREVVELAQVRQVDGEHRPVSGQRIDVSQHARSTAVRNDSHPRRLSPVQQLLDLFVAARPGDAVGKRSFELTAAQGHPVGEALAPAMAHACFRVLADQPVFRQTGAGDFPNDLVERRVLRRRGRPDQLLQQRRDTSGQDPRLGVTAPAVPSSHRRPRLSVRSTAAMVFRQ